MMRYVFAFMVLFLTSAMAEIDYELLKTMSVYSGSKTKISTNVLPQTYSELKEVLDEREKEEHSSYAILYFFSNSVSTGSYSSFLQDLAKHNLSHKIKFSTSQCLIGINNSLKSYLLDTREKLGKSDVKKEAIDLINIRMTPEIFENYNITSVPAMALAKCPQSKHPSKCTLLSIAKGDVSLGYFFEKLTQNNLYPKELKE